MGELMNPALLFASWWVLSILLLTGSICLASREQDASSLLEFKLGISSDPLYSLRSWDMIADAAAAAPCDWNGITCDHEKRVVILSLPRCALSGNISPSLGRMPNLQRINLRSNNLSGEIPSSIGSASSLHKIILSDNRLSGRIPLEVTHLQSLETLDLASNRLNGTIPSGIGSLRLERLDLSQNQLTGPIPRELGSLSSLQGALNLSSNLLTGEIPQELAQLPANSSLDLRWNKLSGKIPAKLASKQPASAFLGNPALCGEPLANPCSMSSSSNAPPSASSSSGNRRYASGRASSGLSVKEILAIAVGDAVGIALLGLVFIYCCRRRKPCDYLAKRRRRKRAKSTSVVAATTSSSYSFSQLHQQQDHQQLQAYENVQQQQLQEQHECEEPDCLFCLCCFCCCCCCSGEAPDWIDDGSGGGELVSFEDGGVANSSGGDGKSTSFNLEDLLRASAYVISKSGSSIVYKTVLESGLTLAVRRLANDCSSTSSKRQKEFDSEVQILGRIRHPCIVKLRAYYSGPDEKLLVYDYIANGSLCTALHGQSAPYSLTSLTWTERLRIARRVAQGLAHIHECGPRKYIHGDVRPKNILLSSNMEAFISDFGLSRLITITGSALNSRSGSRNASSSSSIAVAAAAAAAATATTAAATPAAATPAAAATPTSSSSGVPSLSISSGTPIDVLEDHFKTSEESAAYRPPESMTTTTGRSRATQKWDVYAFGVVMLELLSGKKPVALHREQAAPGTAAVASGSAAATTAVAGASTTTGSATTTGNLSLVEWAERLWESKRPLSEVLDPSLTHGVTPPQNDVAEFLRIALACVAASPEQRPKMKQVLDWLRKIGGAASSNAP